MEFFVRTLCEQLNQGVIYILKNRFEHQLLQNDIYFV